MARSINRLADRTVQAITEPGRYADGGNLFLVVDKLKSTAEPEKKAKPAKRWVFIYRAPATGKLREMGLGSLSAISLAVAREQAAACRELLGRRPKIDPIDARRAEEAKARPATFGEVATDLHAARKGGWKSDQVKIQWLATLQRHATSIWNTPVDSVGTEDVLGVLRPLWITKSETARKLMGRLEAVIDAAQARGLIPQDRANPARWKGHLSHLLAKRPRLQKGHHPALPYVDMPSFMIDLRKREALAAVCMEFAILTAARSGEAMGAVWREIDIDAKVWNLPGARMKSGRPHRVPLSDAALVVLRKVEPLRTSPDDFVFPGRKAGRPLSVMALEMLLRRMKCEAVPHGFRSTFRDWAGDCTSYPRELAEEAIAHSVGSAVEKAYRRKDALERRRGLMALWADFLAGVTANNVVQGDFRQTGT